MRAHWLDTDETLTPDTLREHGVLSEALPVDAFRGPLDALKGARGYIQEDQIELQPSTPGLDAICAKFLDEHLHDEDEVRFVLAGEGIFDIRSLGDRFMRVVVGPGDSHRGPRAAVPPLPPDRGADHPGGPPLQGPQRLGADLPVSPGTSRAP